MASKKTLSQKVDDKRKAGRLRDLAVKGARTEQTDLMRDVDSGDPKHIERLQQAEADEREYLFERDLGRSRRLSNEAIQHLDRGCGYADRLIAEEKIGKVKAYRKVAVIFWPEMEDDNAGDKLMKHARALELAISGANYHRQLAYQGALTGRYEARDGKIVSIGEAPGMGALEAAQNYIDRR